MIPRILHQTWKTREIPEAWLPFQRTWRELHPTWEYRLWTDADLRQLVEESHPSFLSVYDAYPLEINRVDAARYLILERHGGVYVDMDFECLRPVEALLAGHEILLGLEPEAHLEVAKAASRGIDRIVCNAFMASVPGHAFWGHVLAELRAHCDEEDPLDSTGPFRLTNALGRWPERDAVALARSEALYPLTKDEVASGMRGDAEARGQLDGGFAVHHWSGSWIQTYKDECARRRRQGREPVGGL
ncbi:MAG: glycoside transferase family 32 [Deltaproteobacteria bacterium]|nr:glycoside transferase family 32 [Deltaproteobacteria bacterium]